jgi:hypothetical protein
MLKNSIVRVKDATVRVIVTLVNGQHPSGTGFFLSDMTLLTCAHVAFGSDGHHLEEALAKLKDKPKEVRAFFESRVKKVEIFTNNGTPVGSAQLDTFDLKHDATVLKLRSGKSHAAVEYDHTVNIALGEHVAFCGYPKLSNSTDPLSYSFMLNEGIVSGFPENAVGGFVAYKHLQVNAISVGGFSGSPLFLEDSGIVVGFINGNSNCGFETDVYDQNGNVTKQSVQIPLPIAYATPLIAVDRILEPQKAAEKAAA